MQSNQSDSMSTGLFIPTNNIWEIEQIQQSQELNNDMKEILVRLYQNLNNIAIATNLKDSGYYVLQEFITGQLFFQNPAINQAGSNLAVYRQSFRMVVNFGQLPNATTKTVKHNIPITSLFTITRIYGAATQNNGDSFIPLPYPSLTVNGNIELSGDRTNIIITTGIDYSAYTQSIIIIEYLKQ